MVTTTAGRSGKFELHLFHSILEEVGQLKGHFSPVNSIAFAPGRGNLTCVGALRQHSPCRWTIVCQRSRGGPCPCLVGLGFCSAVDRVIGGLREFDESYFEAAGIRK